MDIKPNPFIERINNGLEMLAFVNDIDDQIFKILGQLKEAVRTITKNQIDVIIEQKKNQPLSHKEYYLSIIDKDPFDDSNQVFCTIKREFDFDENGNPIALFYVELTTLMQLSSVAEIKDHLLNYATTIEFASLLEKAGY